MLHLHTIPTSTPVVPSMSLKRSLLLMALLFFCFSSFAVSPITGVMTLCKDDTTALHDATPGGTWTSSNTAIATVGPLTGVVTGVATGNATITYTVGSSYVTTMVTVNFLPWIMAGVTDMCSGISTTWTDATPGGVWSTSNSAVTTIGSLSGVINGIAAGYDTMWYSTGPACYVSQYMNIRQTPTISGTPLVALGGTRTLVGTPSGGSWSTSSSNITIGTSSGIVTGVTLGTAPITYLSSACPAYETVTVAATTGVRISSAESAFRVYPNPSSGKISISWHEAATGTAQVAIFDVTGRMIHQTELKIYAGDGDSGLDLSKEPDGTYLVNITNGQAVLKTVIQIQR